VAGSNSTGKVSYGIEGWLYQEVGLPTIICGPGCIAQAHPPDEFVAQSELDACYAFHPPARGLTQVMSSNPGSDNTRLQSRPSIPAVA
jgi:hypothetical protein